MKSAGGGRTMPRVGINLSSGNRPSALASLHDRHLQQMIGLLIHEPSGVTLESLQFQLGLSRSAVASLLKEIEPIRGPDGAERPDGAGRPPSRYRIARDMGVVVGIDIGSKRVDVAVADLTGELLSSEVKEVRLPRLTARNPKDTLSAATNLVQAELRAVERTAGDVAAVGVSLPGAVSLETRTLVDDAMRRWRTIDVREHLAALMGTGDDVPIVLDNDADVALLAEQRWGAVRPGETTIYLKWATGVGSALLLDDRIWRGDTGVAMELGHLVVPVEPVERKALQLDRVPLAGACSRCRQHGCVEQLAGGSRMREVLGAETVAEGLELVRTNAMALDYVMTAACLIGRAVGVVATLINPTALIIGGGARAALDILESPLKRGIEETSFPQARRALSRIVGSETAGAAGARGAVATAVEAGAVGFLRRRL